ncbi:UNVERIFIED_CONTAM: hypothetical protein NCL1_59280 [Trichonephila clavipes]
MILKLSLFVTGHSICTSKLSVMLVASLEYGWEFP